MDEADTLTNAASSELMANSVNSTELAAANLSSWDSSNENTVDLSANSSSRTLELAALTQELNSNTDLLKQVGEPSQALAESPNILPGQKEQSKSKALLFIQQTQELAVALEQVKQLWQELETFHQTVQRQQILIETLTVQLESSQAMVAWLEREFALNQQCYNEQSDQLNAVMPLCPQPVELPYTTVEEPQALESNDSEIEEAQFEDLFKPLEANLEQVTVNSTEQVLPTQIEQSNEQAPSTQIEQSDPPQMEIASFTTTTNVNWPSPVVYPSRPLKGRKSFAAVELPTFLLQTPFSISHYPS